MNTEPAAARYAESPYFQGLSVSERVKGIAYTCIRNLERRRLTPDVLREQIDLSAAQKDYELSEGIRIALDHWAKQPQLSLL